MCSMRVPLCGPSTGVRYTQKTVPVRLLFLYLSWSLVKFLDLPSCHLVDLEYKQYLAVGPLPTSSHAPEAGVKVARPSPACIQIWSLSPTQPVDSAASKDDRGVMRCEMVLCVDCGPAYTLKWCPLPSHDKVSILSRKCK